MSIVISAFHRQRSFFPSTFERSENVRTIMRPFSLSSVTDEACTIFSKHNDQICRATASSTAARAHSSSASARWARRAAATFDYNKETIARPAADGAIAGDSVGTSAKTRMARAATRKRLSLGRARATPPSPPREAGTRARVAPRGIPTRRARPPSSPERDPRRRKLSSFVTLSTAAPYPRTPATAAPVAAATRREAGAARARPEPELRSARRYRGSARRYPSQPRPAEIRGRRNPRGEHELQRSRSGRPSSPAADRTTGRGTVARKPGKVGEGAIPGKETRGAPRRTREALETVLGGAVSAAPEEVFSRAKSPRLVRGFRGTFRKLQDVDESIASNTWPAAHHVSKAPAQRGGAVGEECLEMCARRHEGKVRLPTSAILRTPMA